MVVPVLLPKSKRNFGGFGVAYFVPRGAFLASDQVSLDPAPSATFTCLSLINGGRPRHKGNPPCRALRGAALLQIERLMQQHLDVRLVGETLFR
jgi:hypothetical protein